MKQLFFIIAMLCSSAAWCQSQSDYEHVLAKFQQYYNTGKTDSIVGMYSDSWGPNKKDLWSDAINNEQLERFGKMRSFKYEGIDTSDNGKVRFFLVTFDKSTNAMSFTLDKQNKLETFRFMTMSDYINSKLSKYYKGEGKKFYNKNK